MVCISNCDKITPGMLMAALRLNIPVIFVSGGPMEADALWRATGMTDDDFGKPIIAVVNSFTQFVPGHVHLRDLGKLVAEQIEAAGGVAKEFNTIAVDDGIATEFRKRSLACLPAKPKINMAGWIRLIRNKRSARGQQRPRHFSDWSK
ncbi:hypothetical protein CRX72_28015 [Pantoea sp. BRM17]|nr:hypothetical protein CRX72_28015 [Pantoea sp. BRM17]